MADDWRVVTNSEYQKVMTFVTGLASSTLIFPSTFMREIIGKKDHENLLDILPWQVWPAWISLVLCLLVGLVFQGISARYVKALTMASSIFGPPSSDYVVISSIFSRVWWSSETIIEKFRDYLILVTCLLLAVGMFFMGWFIIRGKA